MSTAENEEDYFNSYMQGIQRRKQEILSECEKGDGDSGHVKCRKCNGNRVRYVLIQTRSADEASSAFFQCKDCHARWSQR